MIYVILGIILVILIVTLIFYINKKKLDEINNNIIICHNKMDESLDEKQKLIDKIAKKAKNKDILKLIKQETDTIFEKEKNLFDAKWNLNKLINEDKFKPTKEDKKIIQSLNELEETIEGLKDFYNSKVSIYNYRLNKKPLCYLYKLLKLENKKSFSLKRIENYEILKD